MVKTVIKSILFKQYIILFYREFTKKKKKKL